MNLLFQFEVLINLAPSHFLVCEVLVNYAGVLLGQVSRELATRALYEVACLLHHYCLLVLQFLLVLLL